MPADDHCGSWRYHLQLDTWCSTGKNAGGYGCAKPSRYWGERYLCRRNYRLWVWWCAQMLQWCLKSHSYQNIAENSMDHTSIQRLHQVKTDLGEGDLCKGRIFGAWAMMYFSMLSNTNPTARVLSQVLDRQLTRNYRLLLSLKVNRTAWRTVHHRAHKLILKRSELT